MTSPQELGAAVDRLLACFREQYEQTARFREDRELIDALSPLARPLLAALHEASATAVAPEGLHDAYAQLGLLCRHAAVMNATASVAVTIPQAVEHAVELAGHPLSARQKLELALVAAEAYSAARDEQTTRALRQRAAESQVAIKLAPHCCAILLAGTHDEAELGPVLERFARELLHDEVRGCLLDVTRLSPIDQELARALGRFCEQAVTLGVQLALVSSSPQLAEDFRAWSLLGPRLAFLTDTIAHKGPHWPPPGSKCDC